jgi:hypothetical protein
MVPVTLQVLELLLHGTTLEINSSMTCLLITLLPMRNKKCSSLAEWCLFL